MNRSEIKLASEKLARLKQYYGYYDSTYRKPESLPGRHGRKPGCNAAGYFYGDKPSGSNWKFNRVEDFAESVAMTSVGRRITH